MVRGGHIMRYHGLWGTNNEPGPKEGHCLSMRHPREPIDPPACGYSAAHEDVRELTAADTAWLPERIAQAKARGVDYTDAEIALKELSE